MAVRIQVLLDAKERERFREASRRMGLSLSAWLRSAGEEKLAAASAPGRLRTPADLRRFFKECDAREKGREPDWSEHVAVMEQSRRSGRSGT